MGSIRWTSNTGSDITKDTSFIQCVDGWGTHIHELWCLDLDSTTHKVHPTEQVEVISGTIREFVTDYLAKNGRRIQNIGQLYVNDSVQFLGVPAQAWGRGLPLFSTFRLPLRP